MTNLLSVFAAVALLAPCDGSASISAALSPSAQRSADACHERDDMFEARVVVSAPRADVFVLPEVRPLPLTRLTQGKVLPVQQKEGEWFLIAFDDRRWGTRVGYIHCSGVTVIRPPQAADGRANTAVSDDRKTSAEMPRLKTSSGASPTRAIQSAPKGDLESVSGYLEWRRDGYVIADGQRIRLDEKTRLKLERMTSLKTAPLGAEVRAKGWRLADGSLLAKTLELKHNGVALYEREVVAASAQFENACVTEGVLLRPSRNGEVAHVGSLIESGPDFERVQRVMARLLPSYVDRASLRIRVVKTEIWNAAAMPNGAFWIFTGLLEDLGTDDELAVVLGHELAHYTHEHSRRNEKQGMWRRLAAAGAELAIDRIKNENAQAAALILGRVGLQVWANGYNRSLEDQADRVGLRYAYEAGFDVSQGLTLWRRRLEREGELPGVANFFWGSHSRPSDRIRNIEQQIRLNYRSPPGGTP